MPIQKVTREEILDKAYQVFRTQGYNKTSMADVGKAAGIFKSGLYHYFPNKEELMKALLKYTTEQAKEMSLKVLRDGSLTAEQKLDRYFEGYVEGHVKSEGGCLYGNISLECSCEHDEFRALVQEYFEVLASSLEGIFLTQHSKEKAREYALRSVRDIEGGIMMYRVFKDEAHLRHVADNVKNYLREGKQ